MRNLLRKLSILFVFIFFVNISTVYAAPDEPSINAQGAVLIDANTGTVIYGKNEEKQFEPASTTKVMTALIVLEKCSLDDEVTVTQDFTEIDGTAIGLLKGDKVTVRELLLGLILFSGNDCANALAIHVSSSVEDFAKLMTEKAKELGATNTTFKNPSGLPDDGHLTTPHDLALIMKEAIKNKDFIEIANTKSVTIVPKNDPSRSIVVANKNHMIDTSSSYYYKYAIAGKNGYTIRANHTYVAAAEKDGQTLIGAFLYATDKVQNFHDMNNVFDYGFDNYTVVPLYKKDEQVTEYKIGDETIPLLAADDINIILPKGADKNADPIVVLENKKLKRMSFEKGDKIIKGTIYLNDKEYATVDLVAGVSRTYDSSLTFISIFDSSNFALYGQCFLVILAVGAILFFFGRDKHKFD